MIGVTWFGYKGQHSTPNIVRLWLRGEVCLLYNLCGLVASFPTLLRWRSFHHRGLGRVDGRVGVGLVLGVYNATKTFRGWGRVKLGLGNAKHFGSAKWAIPPQMNQTNRQLRQSSNHFFSYTISQQFDWEQYCVSKLPCSTWHVHLTTLADWSSLLPDRC